MKKRFNIKVLGQELSVLSDAEDVHVANVIQFVREKVVEVEKTVKNQTTLNISILVALNIADAYLKLRGEKESMVHQLESKSEKLLHLMDERI